MRHGILGPGGVGGLIAAVLADAGEDVTLIVRPGTDGQYPRQISLQSPFRNIRAQVGVSSNPQGSFDVLWITVKSTQLEDALKLAGNVQAGAVVPLLNGIDHVERLRQRFGGKRVVPATISVESERVAPGSFAHRSPFVILALPATARAQLEGATQIFGRFGFQCVFMDDEATLLWSKLVFLAPIALSTAAARSTIGNVLGNREKAALLEACVREACAVAAHAAARVDADVVMAKIKSLPPGMRSSMEKDIANGSAPELDAIAGPILRGAQKYGIVLKATPELVNLLKASLAN